MNKNIYVSVLAFVLAFILVSSVAASSCQKVGGQNYYTDGVSNFSDAACHNEIIGGASNTQTQASNATGYISTGNANCRYSTAKEQYTDGISFFTDNKCQNESLNDEAVPAPTMVTTAVASVQSQTATATQTVVAAQTVAATSLAQANQRIAALESKISLLASMISQILAILAQK